MKAEYVEYGEEITFSNVNDIANDGERVFAFACLEADCLVFAQIRLGDSIVDFYIINPRRLAATDHTGKFVEITQHTQMAVNTPHRETLEFINPAILKHHQVEMMEQTGEPYTILYDAEIKNIYAVTGDPLSKYRIDDLICKPDDHQYRFRRSKPPTIDHQK